ncbi:hypothetical protein CK203_036033 [Vitis vinifera]|uniref:Reverse transcriptase zinc-binding domain-containing protein n=1 Tax=Vitis vinifera TaxID=29760 RepID=A0A438HR10_VITVI|nr:hypothetical protein CK203_036033 [Vitis vinifera]
MLRGHKPSLEEDSVLWRQGRSGRFRVKEAYSLLTRSNDTGFPSRSIWVARVPTKVAFFAWEATWGKVLTLDRLQRRGVQLPNCCFLCGCEEENVNHILIHCTVVRALWDIVFGLVDVKWVFPETVKEVLASWRGSFVGKKRKKIWDTIPLSLFGPSLDSPDPVLERNLMEDTRTVIRSGERSHNLHETNGVLDQVSSPLRREVLNRYGSLN